MATLKLYKSRWRGLRLLGMILPFVLIGLWMISKEQPGTFNYVMAWVMMSFFGLGIPVGLYVLLDRRPQIIITEDGVWDRMVKQNEIKWEQITAAYSTEMYNQKYIAIKVDDTFVYRKPRYKWLAKWNKIIAGQEINLNLSQIKIDENQLTLFLHKMKNADRGERNNLIRLFQSNYKLNTTSDFRSYFLYMVVVIVLAVLSISSVYAFWGIMIIMGISALVLKCYGVSSSQSKLRYYAQRMAYLGFITMVLVLFIFETYDYTTNKIGVVLTTAIEKYKESHGRYPKDLKTVTESIDLNSIQTYFIGKMIYTSTYDTYQLKIENLKHNLKQFDTAVNEWR